MKTIVAEGFGGVVRLACAAMAVPLAVAVPARAADEQRPPKVVLLDPMSAPLVVDNGAKYILNGMAQHRRVVSKGREGATRIDVSYNVYKAGLEVEQPYAYNADEICYFASGEMWLESDGEKVFAKPGYFMWRPAGAATQKGKVLADAVTICAFGPAREEGTGFRLPASEVGKWNGDPAKKPKVVFRDYRDVLPILRPGAAQYGDGRLVSRRIFTWAKDGIVALDASHNVYRAGLESGSYGYKVDEICWLEKGEIEMINAGVTQTFRAGQIMYRPAGAVTDHAKATQDTVSICFLAPARTSDWGHILSLKDAH
jgi:ethanolamine utilization protein EutQ (cupin superfamily)